MDAIDLIDFSIPNDWVAGFKAFDNNLKCQGGEDTVNHHKWFQYRIGGEYKLEDYEELSICERGFHFCTKLEDVYNYYPYTSRICLIFATGKVIRSKKDSKCVTDKILIFSEINNPKIKSDAIKASRINRQTIIDKMISEMFSRR